MKLYPVVFELILGGMLFVSTSALAQSNYGPITGNAESGKELYYAHACYACHGYTGIGRQNLANDVSGMLVNEQVFTIYLRARSELNPDVPSQAMPNYSENVVSDEEARDLYAYIRSFRDDPPAVDDIPALRSILESAESPR